MTAEIYYAAPIQQYILDDQYERYPNDEDNEVLTPRESSGPRYVGNGDDESSAKYYIDDALNPVSYTEFERGQAQGAELLQTEEARNTYRPYVRYRQILRRRTRVPISRRYDGYPGSSALSGYASHRDRFPTVA